MTTSCVSDRLDKDEAKYSSLEKLSELTKVQFPELQFVEGTETKSIGAESKDYKLIFTHGSEKENVIKSITSLLEQNNADWSQSYEGYTFRKIFGSNVTPQGANGSASFSVLVSIPQGSNDTIYIREIMSFPQKILRE